MAVKRFDLPDLGEGLEEAEIVEWHVGPGDRVVADQPLVSVETDKALVEIPAPWAATVKAILAEPGAIAAVGAPLVEFETEARADVGAVVGDLEPVPEEPEREPKPAVAAARPEAVRAMPAARALAAERGIDLAGVNGTGPGGVVTRADVVAIAPAAVMDEEGWAPLAGARRAMAKRMAAAASVVRASVHDVADVSAWMTQDADVLVRLVRAVAKAAAAEPALNAWFDPKTARRRLHERIDLGLAVDSPDGLYVPVLRDVVERDPQALRDEANRLIGRVRARRLGAADQAEPTLTLSNYGPLGGRHADLVVLPPQVAIIGAGRAYHADGLGRSVLPLSLTFDHRAVTGGEAARFLGAAIADLERPE